MNNKCWGTEMDVSTLPAILKIDVEYYDSAEQDKLRNYDSADLIEKVAGNTIEVPTRDFLAYYIFYKKTPGKPGFSDFEDLSEKTEHALSELDGYFNFEGGSLHTNRGEKFRDAAVSERIGEAIGLSVVNQIHGLSRADWNKLEEIRGAVSKKTLDYEIGSDGENIIHIENKGSLGENNSKKSPNISNHKKSITDKKVSIRGDKEYPYPSNLMYGTIGVIDGDIERNTKCWLLDPDPEMVDVDPFKIRLLNRYDYLLSVIRMISPQSQLTTALTTRFHDLVAIEDYMALDGLPVRRASGELFSLYLGDYASSPLHAAKKSSLPQGDSIGKVVAYGEQQLIYFGIDMFAINAMVSQEFGQIVQYSNKERQSKTEVQCHFNVTQQRELSSQLESYFSYTPDSDEKPQDVSFDSNAKLVSFQEGLIFALLEKNNSNRKRP